MCEKREALRAEIEKAKADSRAGIEKAETDEYNYFKRRHESFVNHVGETGPVEETTTTPAPPDFVYVVTSIHRCEDPFSPRLEGVYTTCEKAIAGAQSAFERISQTYRDGTFVPDETRFAKADWSEFLRPRVKSMCRIMCESFGEEDTDDFTAIAINALPLDTQVENTVPLLSETMAFDGVQHERKNIGLADTSVRTESASTVHALFKKYGLDEEDISLLGVFQNKWQAISIARGMANADWENEEEANLQNQEARKKDRGLLFQDEDFSCCIAMETVTLDSKNEYKGEIDLPSWMNPKIECYGR